MQSHALSIYDTLGARTILNAKGTSTRVSGALLHPEVTAAMQEAAQHCVDMAELQATASKHIADAITERTAAIVDVAHSNARPTIEEVARVANSQHVPFLVDAATGPLRNARTEVRTGGSAPKFILTLNRGYKLSAMDLCIALQNGAPSIHADPSQTANGIVSFNPTALRPEDPDAIGRRLRELVG